MLKSGVTALVETVVIANWNAEELLDEVDDEAVAAAGADAATAAAPLGPSTHTSAAPLVSAKRTRLELVLPCPLVLLRSADLRFISQRAARRGAALRRC